ncbi:MAG: serine hydrolase domain-containing protein, partial [Gemmatimonadaceae bacterium]
MLKRNLFAAAVIVLVPGLAQGQDAALARKVDSVANQVLHATGVPSATVAVVRHGQLAYANAYGCARLNPCVNATPDMKYAIGSISKQFTATAILLLQQEGKL